MPQGFMDFWRSDVKAEREKRAVELAKRQAAEVARLNRLYGQYADNVTKAGKRTNDLTKAVKDGTYVRQTRQLQSLNREYEKTRREAELIARYGERWGRYMGRHGAAMEVGRRLGGYAASAAFATGTALTHRGFSGTVESNRLDLEMRLAGRELAGSFKPAMDAATRGVQRFTKWMERRSPAEQDIIMFGGLAASGLVAMRALFGGGALAAGARMMTGGLIGGGPGMTRAGMLRAGVGLAGAGALAYGVSEDNPLLGAGGGAALGFAAGGPIGALAGGALGGAASAPAHRADENAWRYYTRMRREEGMSRVGATTAMLGRSLAVLTGAEPAGPPGAPDPTRRRVTPADAGFDEPGAMRDRMETALSLVDAARAGERGAGGLGGVATDMIREIRDVLVRAAGGAGVPPLLRPGEAGGVARVGARGVAVP